MQGSSVGKNTSRVEAAAMVDLYTVGVLDIDYPRID